MTEPATKTYADYVLPPNVVSKVDLSRMVTDLERIDNELTTADVRAKAGSATSAQPVMSEQLVGFLELNQMQLGDSKQRSDLIKQLHLLKDRLPVVHMTFATPADPESLQQIAGWLRQSVHPQAVITAGLQPALVGGVYLRMSNKVKDLSLRAKLKAGHGILVKDLEALRGKN